MTGDVEGRIRAALDEATEQLRAELPTQLPSAPMINVVGVRHGRRTKRLLVAGAALLAGTASLAAAGYVRNRSTTVPHSSEEAVCPTAQAPPATSRADIAAAAQRLEPTLGAVATYGAEHADEFGSSGVIWQGGEPRVYASFTGDLAAHRAALEAEVDSPGELVVCRAPMSGVDAAALQAAIQAEFGDVATSVRIVNGVVHVRVPAAAEGVAGEIVGRYGDKVDAQVGALAYPIGRATRTCAPDQPTEHLDGLRIEVLGADEPISSHADAVAPRLVRLTNDGSTPITFSSGYADAVITNPDGEVVASSIGLERDELGFPVSLSPGESTELPLLIDVASCDPSLGYTLPPGSYQVRALVQHSDGNVTTLASPLVPITIVE